MIVAFLESPAARAALREATLPDEDLILGLPEGYDALHRGFPRVVVVEGGDTRLPGTVARDLPILRLAAGPYWSTEATAIAVYGVDDTPGRLRALLHGTSRSGTWVDGTLAALARTVGGGLPPAFRGLGRRVLEYPARYPDLHAVARLSGLRRGALKARFRRRGLQTPSNHLRWLRALAASHVLTDPTMTVAQGAHLLGFTSGGNLSRALHTATGLTPGDLRDSAERTALLVRFAERFLDDRARRNWEDFEDIFLRGSTAA